ncbi:MULTISPECIES: DapH/DapD/GlmU-related protein [Oceanotoga]|uniref:UDP-3-O-[3-hydroxymyristoyl] glucosamine N-acyltransferase n=1 Tax=Oceanotoga teriensis TaxID=515440 RepID=A0AA45HIM4_9BACT|nr:MULTISPECIES: DapH/DapD/GlmU-related protein [Oceanotoga]MDN5342007.1 hypothetical protein [Oceanotoga sp.]MDO7976034.1 hypothetical protein [Oceanotoga teriensis]PWJ92079.1 UDP-3-O-[3-hydroxymyristoyl] glucosamine N-acyltransferase [Oceanotoga teriensis]
MHLYDISKAINRGHIISEGYFDHLSKMGDIPQKNCLTFFSNIKFIDNLQNENITCIVTKKELHSEIEKKYPHRFGIILDENPKELFFLFHNYTVENNLFIKDFDNVIDSTSIISNHAYISEKSVKIGKNCIIEPGVIIHPHTIIGDNTIIRSGTVLSTSGFEVCKLNGIMKVVKHGGQLIIGNNVELQANNTVAKGLFHTRNTIIEDEVFTDNLVYIAHGVHIKRYTRIGASVNITGMVDIGSNCWIGPGSTIRNRIKIGNDAYISMGSVVTKNVLDSQHVSGNFAIDHEKFINNIKKY